MSNNIFKDINCNFNLYKSFYVVAITGSFSKAAEVLNVSQPALSYSIKQLEEQLNINLFYRKGKGILLTSEGNTIFEYVKNAFELLIKGEEKIKKIDKNKDFIIGVPTHIFSAYLKDKVCLFLKENADYNLKIVEKGSSSLKEMLENREIDIMIDFCIDLKDKKKYCLKHILQEKLCLAGKKTFIENYRNTGSLENIPLVLPALGSRFRNHLDEYFALNKIKKNIKVETYTSETLLELVRQGVGIGLFFEKYIENEDLFKIDSINLPFLSLDIAYLNDNKKDIIKDFDKMYL